MKKDGAKFIYFRGLAKIGVSVLLFCLIFQNIIFSVTPAYAATKSWNFSNPLDYTFDSDKIEISSDQAALKAPNDWYDPSWHSRKAITINNTDNSNDLTNYQIKIDVTYDSDMQVDFDDIRFSDSDGVTLINYWLESKTDSTSAAFWTKVPSISALSSKTIYMYFGNSGASSASNGDNTFEFFDDFETPSAEEGYYNLSSAQTVLQQNQAWETSAPHTLSVVENNSGGYQYWGYYGLQDYPGGGPIGLARSNNLSTWDKYEFNPIIAQGRWPSVLKVGSTFYMIYTKYDGLQRIALATSTDGINFTDIKTIVQAEAGYYNDGSNLFYNSNDNKYYLYWVRINQGTGFHEIQARNASNIEGLDAASNVTVLSSTSVLAAPNMMYYDSTYFLSTEILVGVWNTRVYSSSSPTSGFIQTFDSPVLTDGSACFFQHIIGTIMHGYYCKLTGSTWTLDYRTADLSAGRNQRMIPNISKWTKSGGTWTIQNAVQQDGSSGSVANAVTTANQILSSFFSGDDYIIESYGKQIFGNEWGLGVRVTDVNNLYSVNLYENLDATYNLYIYKWINGSPSVVSRVAIGTINLDTWYKMTVKAYSNNIDVYINDVLKIHTTDSQYLSGKIGLWGEAGVMAKFNNVIVRRYTSPEPTTNVGSKAFVYDSNNPTIQPTAINARAFTSLSDFTETATKNGGEIKYQISNDSGITWYWYNAGWVATASGYTEANNVSDINANITTFPVGGGSFLFKAYLHSDGTQLVQLDLIDLTYTNNDVNQLPVTGSVWDRIKDTLQRQFKYLVLLLLTLIIIISSTILVLRRKEFS